MNHRTLKLTHDEIELITNALDDTVSTKLEFVKEVKKRISLLEKKRILRIVKDYYILCNKIKDGQKDV